MAKHLRSITEDKRLEGVKKSKVEDGQVYGGADASVQMNDPETVKFTAQHKVEKHDDRVGNKEVPYKPTTIKQALLKPEEKRHGNTPEKSKAVYKAANEAVSCNESQAGINCGVHGLDDCSGMTGKKQLILDKDKKMNEDTQIVEVITKKTKAGEIIKDFMKSKNPKFAGDSPEKRKERALGAYYKMHPEKSNVKEDAAEPMLEGGKKKKSKKEDGPIHPTGQVPNTTQNVKADTGYSI
jgi:hypothetical protein